MVLDLCKERLEVDWNQLRAKLVQHITAVNYLCFPDLGGQLCEGLKMYDFGVLGEVPGKLSHFASWLYTVDLP